MHVTSLGFRTDLALLTAAGFIAPDVRRTSVPFDVLESRPAGN